MKKEEIVKNVVYGIDDMILESEDRKYALALEDVFAGIEEKELFESEEEFEKLVKEELKAQKYNFYYDNEKYEPGTLVVEE